MLNSREEINELNEQIEYLKETSDECFEKRGK